VVWQAKKAAAGYAQITWPKEWGGGGGTPIQSIIFAQEESKYVQNYGYFQIGLGMCVPTVTDERHRYRCGIVCPESTSYRIALNMRGVIYLPVTSVYCKLGSALVN
jgi:hypothetical protein